MESLESCRDMSNFHTCSTWTNENLRLMYSRECKMFSWHICIDVHNHTHEIPGCGNKQILILIKIFSANLSLILFDQHWWRSMQRGYSLGRAIGRWWLPWPRYSSLELVSVIGLLPSLKWQFPACYKPLIKSWITSHCIWHVNFLRIWFTPLWSWVQFSASAKKNLIALWAQLGVLATGRLLPRPVGMNWIHN